MPLTEKGKTIIGKMYHTYKSEKKAKSVFYAMINKGNLKKVEKKR